jgi:hypothetical protein
VVGHFDRFGGGRGNVPRVLVIHEKKEKLGTPCPENIFVRISNGFMNKERLHQVIN